MKTIRSIKEMQTLSKAARMQGKTIAFVPTMCMFSECLKRAYEMIPELGDIVRRRTG